MGNSVEARSLLSILAEGMHKMKTSQLQKKIGTAILGLFLILGVGIATSSTAQAQDPWGRWQQNRRDRDRDYRDRDVNNRNRGRRGRDDDYPNLGGTFQLRQTALNAGYNEGIKEGRKDNNRNRGYR